MAKLLHIDCSPRGERSQSRTLAREFMEAWKRQHTEDEVLYRDLGHNPAPHVTEEWMAGAFNPPDQWSEASRAAMTVSDGLIDELLSADRILVSTPMFNLNIPSTFKAYIDQVVRVGRTFKTTDAGYEPLVHGKKMLVISARGGAFAGTPFDFQEPYLKAIFGFIGIGDIQFVHAEGMNMGDETRMKALAQSRARLTELAATW